jgi:hypothetical protein
MLILAATAAACSEDDSTGDPTRLDGSMPMMDSGQPMTTPPEFDFEIVDGLGSPAVMGDFAVATIAPDGSPAVAYGSLDTMNRRTIRFATRNPDGTWTTEEAVDPDAFDPSVDDNDLLQVGGGLGFDFVDGTPTLAYLGGTEADPGQPAPLVVGAGDLVVAERTGGTWNERILVEDSNRNEPCPSPQNLCNQGTRVGFSASLVGLDGGLAIAYQDNHRDFGAEQDRPDLEVFVEGAGALNTAVNPESTAGFFSSITTLPDGRIAIAHYIRDAEEERDNGVWAAVQVTGAEFTQTQVDRARTNQRTSIVAAPDGTLWLAFFDVDDQDLVVANSSDDGVTWDVERVAEAGNTGLYPSIGFDVLGRVVVAHTFCGSFGDTDCPGALGFDSEVRLARLEGDSWEIYLVDDGQGSGGVGAFNSLVRTGDGRLGIAFQDTDNNDLLFSLEIR